MSDYRWSARAAHWGPIILGVIVALLGLAMLLGGVDLIRLGGSWYYAICGAAITVAGVLMALGRSLGAVLYLLAWAATIPWAFWDMGGFDAWGLLPRLFGPTILALLVVLVLPVLRGHERGQSARRPIGGAV